MCRSSSAVQRGHCRAVGESEQELAVLMRLSHDEQTCSYYQPAKDPHVSEKR